MDERNTLKVNQGFLEIFENLHQNKSRAAMLIDNNGLERVEGFIDEIKDNEGEIYVVLNNGCEIRIADVVGVNGIFISDFSTC